MFTQEELEKLELALKTLIAYQEVGLSNTNEVRAHDMVYANKELLEKVRSM